jgi:hypothetical protein
VLDLRGFNLNDKLELDPAFLTADEAHDHDDHDGTRACGDHEHVHTEACDHSHDHHHSHHSDDIAAFVFKSERPFDPERLDSSSAAWCRSSVRACCATRACCDAGAPTARWCSRACIKSWAATWAQSGAKTSTWQQNGVYW